MFDTQIPVVQSVPAWLPRVERWLYDEVRFLPSDIVNHVVCETTHNLGEFPLEHIHSFEHLPRPQYVWDKALRKIGLRRHLHFYVERARACGARVIHSHFGDTAWRDLGVARRVPSAKHVVTFYGLDVNYLPMLDPRWNERYAELFANVDCVLCEGEHMARSIVALGAPQEKVRVHHLGVDVDAVPFRPRLWDPATPLRVLIAASFREKKGIPFALEALGRLQHKVAIEITIIGDAKGSARSEKEKQRILATIDKHELHAKTRLLGYTSSAVMREEALQHHVFLSPSVTADDGDTEGGAPVAIIEMCASGMAVVSTRHCDIPGVVAEGAGLLADERDVDGLVRHLEWLAAHPTEWAPMLGAARTHIENEFNARSQGEKLGAIYRELVGST